MKEYYTENEYAEFWLDDGVVYQMLKPGLLKFTSESAEAVVRDRKTVLQGIDRPVFIDLNNASSIDKVARNYFSTKESFTNLSAAALMTKSVTVGFMAGLFLSFSRPPMPVKLFKDKEKALKWLSGFKKKQSSPKTNGLNRSFCRDELPRSKTAR